MGDEARWLTLEGRRVARAVGHKLKGEQVALDVILTSPLVRAVQTAELVAEALDYLGPIETLGALAPGVPPRIAAEELGRRGGSVAAVGHEPTISAIGAFLLSSPAFPPFRKGQVCVIDDGKPAWWLHPETLAIERLLV